jgi:hypothetical protein
MHRVVASQVSVRLGIAKIVQCDDLHL